MTARTVRARVLIVLGVWIVAAATGSGRARGETWQESWGELPTLYGTTGLIVTPSAYVLPERTLRVGGEWVGKQWADHPRRSGYYPGVQTDNDHLHLAVGFFPRLELAVRISYFPTDRLTVQLPGKGTVDRGASGRLQVLKETPRLPAVAFGLDDVKGTRRFHSLYGVASKTVATRSDFLKARISGGYGSHALHARVHILDGVFGGAEFVVGNTAAAIVEYDTEKWNAGIRVFAFRHVAAQFSFLHLEGAAGGISWTQPL